MKSWRVLIFPLFVMIILIFSSSNIFGQYRLSYQITEVAHPGNVTFYGADAALSVDGGQTTFGLGMSGSVEVSNRPSSLVLSTTFYYEQGTSGISICPNGSSGYTLTGNSSECFSNYFDYTDSFNCWTYTLGVTVEALGPFNLSDPTTKVYCGGASIPLTATTTGYSFYTWQYQIKNESGTVLQDWNTFTTTTINTVSVSKSMLPGLDYREVVAFRYSIGNCDPNTTVSNVITGYSFLAAPVVVTGVTNQIAPVCLGGTDGYVSGFIIDPGRTAEPGETFHVGVYNSKVVPDIDDPNPSNVVDGNALPSGAYYVLAESNYGNCGAPQWLDVAVPAGPRDPLIGSATVTSDYNGSQINCNGDTNGEITVVASGGKAPYSYSLTGSSSFLSSNVLTAGAGTYSSITIHDSCPTSSMNSRVISAVTVNDVASVGASNLPSYCNNTTTSGEITVTKTGGTGNLSDYSYSYDGGAFESSSVKTGLTTGVAHTVIVKDKNGCTSLPQDVIIPDPLSGSSAVTNPACGTGTGKITISGVTGGNGSYTYSLNGAAAVTGNLANGHEFTGLLTSTNSVVVSDVKGCTTPAPFSGLNVSVPSLITVNVSSVVPESCAGKNDGAITVTASNAIGSVKYSLNGGPLQVSNTFTGQPAGSTYYVMVKQDNVNGCTGTSAPIAIGQITPLSGIINENQSILCYGDTGIKGAALDLTPSGGTPDAGTYVYDWTKAGATIATTQDVTGIPAGTYSVTITDKKLCSTTLPNIVVSQPALLTSSISKTDVSCNPAHGVALSSNGAINLTPAGGTTPYQYAWSSNNVSQDLSGLVAGTYSVTITDNNGCVANNTATLLQPAAVVSGIGSSSDVTCKGLNNGSITITATGGTSVFSYSKNGTSWQASPVFSSLSPTGYTIITKDQNGCTSQLTQAIAEPNALVAAISDIVNTTCGNTNGSAQVNVTGGNGNYQYAWKNTFNQTVSTASVLSNASGDAYTVTVTDSKNCSDSRAALISNSDGAIINISSIDPTTCYDSHDGKAVITVTSGLAPYAITWSNAETGLTPAALLPGDNIVRVSDANNCVAVTLVAVPFPDAIAIDTKIITPPTCFGSTDAGIALTMKGGNGSYSYAWSNGPVTSSITNVAAGDYGITVKDSKNCTYTSSIKIDAIPELKLSVINEKLPTCFDGSDGALTVGTTGGNGTYSYQWTDGPAAPQIENIKAGAYNVKVTDVKGCNLSSSFTLNNPVRFTISIDDKTICVGQKYKIASDVTNGSYTWTSTKGFNSAQREVTLTDPDTYTLKVINAQGCTAQDSFELKTSTDLLHADLLMISEAYQADTVVVIDLSWPLPDAVTWLFPTQASVVEQNNDLGYAFLKFNKTGQYDVAIRANLGECVDTYSQAILIKEGGVTNSGGRQSTINVIQYFEVHPNPNKGDFRILAELSEAQPVKLMLVNTEGNKILINQYDEGSDNYSWDFSIPDLTQGTYFLVLKAGKETKAIRMMKL